MVQSLIEHGKIRTTLIKAKEVKSFAEKVITLAKVNNLTNRRRVIAMLQDRRLVDEEQEFTGQTVIQKLFDEVGPMFAARNGGYTRIIKLGTWRIGDAGDLAFIELVTDEAAKPKGSIRKSAGLRRKRYERRNRFASAAMKKGTAGGPTSPSSSAETASATADESAPAE